MNKYEWSDYYRGKDYKTDYFYVEKESGIVVAKILSHAGPAPYIVNIKGRGDMWEFVRLGKAKEYVENNIEWWLRNE